MKAFLAYWLPVLVWVALIFVGSTDLMSAEHTSRIIVPFLHWLYPTMSPLTVLRIQFFLRKTAHVTEYAVLAALLYRALVHTFLLRRSLLAGGLVLFFCGGYAISDEFHQSFVPSRTASARDVAIDLGGAILAMLLYLWWARRRMATRKI